MLAVHGDAIIIVGDPDTADSIAGTVQVCGDDKVQEEQAPTRIGL